MAMARTVGSVRQKAGGWEVRLSIGIDPRTGRRRQISRYVSGTRAEAEQVLLRLRLEQGDGRQIEAERATVADLLTTWLSSVETRLSPTTLRGYRSIVAKYVIPAIGSVSLRRLTGADLDRLYRDLEQRGGTRTSGLSPTTVRQTHAVLRRALGQAVKWGWLERNPATLASPPTARRHELTPPTPGTAADLVVAARADDDDLADFICLAITTGARRSELCALQWDDVDEVAALLHVRRAVVERGPGDLVVKDTKTHAARRVALDAGTLGVLRARRVRVAERALAAGAPLGPWVFSDDAAQRHVQHPGRMTERFRRLVGRTGNAGVRLHDLRHLAATSLIDAGVPIPTVSKRLGHRDTATTLNVYAHAVEHTDRAAADVLGHALFGRSSQGIDPPAVGARPRSPGPVQALASPAGWADPALVPGVSGAVRHEPGFAETARVGLPGRPSG
jgi:integrase